MSPTTLLILFGLGLGAGALLGRKTRRVPAPKPEPPDLPIPTPTLPEEPRPPERITFDFEELVREVPPEVALRPQDTIIVRTPAETDIQWGMDLPEGNLVVSKTADIDDTPALRITVPHPDQGGPGAGGVFRLKKNRVDPATNLRTTEAVGLLEVSIVPAGAW